MALKSKQFTFDIAEVKDDVEVDVERVTEGGGSCDDNTAEYMWRPPDASVVSWLGESVNAHSGRASCNRLGEEDD